jgi:hypothetical protein
VRTLLYEAATVMLTRVNADNALRVCAGEKVGHRSGDDVAPRAA